MSFNQKFRKMMKPKRVYVGAKLANPKSTESKKQNKKSKPGVKARKRAKSFRCEGRKIWRDSERERLVALALAAAPKDSSVYWQPGEIGGM
jgi:hypothetical protein